MEDVYSLEITKTNLENALRSQFGNNVNFTVTDNGDGSFTVKFDDTDRMYYVESSGKVIENDNILKISTADELKAFRDDVNNGNTYEGKYVYLTNDIILDINEEWEPIGTYLASNTSIADETNIPFCGTFDGKGYVIDGLKITSQDKGKGLFGFAKGATISNLGIGENCSINAGVSYGSITGYAYLGTLIENCYNKAEINATSNNATNIGGIVGTNTSNCIVSNCYNLAPINAYTTVGGIVGNNFGNISNCYNSGNINSNTTNVGGIVGINNGSVSNCYNTNTIQGTGTNVGGIIGLLNNDNSKILNSYNLGLIVSPSGGGGIVGYLLKGTLENNYFLENTVNGSNGTTVEGSTSKTSNELKNLTTILGSAFKKDTYNINQGYPILNWQ